MAVDKPIDSEYESAVSGLLEALQQYEDKELRRRIVFTLKRISQQSKAAVQALTSVLQDDKVDEESQQAAAYALGVIGSREAVQGLVTALYNVNCHAKEATVRVLAAIGSREAVRGLIVGLAIQNGKLRETILRAFSQVNRQIFEAELLIALLHDDERVQKIAARILERMGAADDLPPM